MNEDKRIMEYMVKELKEAGNISSERIRKEFRIGYKRAKRLLNFFVDKGEIKPHSNHIKGYVPTPEFSGLVKDEYIEEQESQRIIHIDSNYVKNLEKQNQRLRDINNRLKRKEKNWTRDYNNAEAIWNGIKYNIDIINEPIELQPVVIGDKNKIAIVQLSDTHFNEGVRKDSVKNTNEYNWQIASKRLQKYAHYVKLQLTYHRINTVIFALTGDLFNSSRRFDELIENQDSLCVALLTGCDLVTKFMLDVTDNGRISSHVYSVFGNESRIRQDYTSIWWEDNFDYLLHKIIEQKLSAYKTFRFEEPALDHSMIIKDVLGANILLIHGHNRTSFENEFIKYGQQKDFEDRVIIDYMIWGHVHKTQLKPESRRSSSLVGSNAYSFHRLGINGYAEQNMHIITKETENRVPTLQTITFNLDYTDEFPGYSMIRDSLYRKNLNVRKFPGV